MDALRWMLAALKIAKANNVAARIVAVEIMWLVLEQRLIVKNSKERLPNSVQIPPLEN